MIQVPQLGGYAIFAPFNNFRGKGPVPVGSLDGPTPYGAFDMAGNVREWCSNAIGGDRLVRGGAWDDNTYMFENKSRAQAMDRSAKNGFRCALYPHPEQIPSSAFAEVKARVCTGFLQGKARPGFRLQALPGPLFLRQIRPEGPRGITEGKPRLGP